MRLTHQARSLLFLCIIAAGLLFRLYRADQYPFGFDQAQILANAFSISQGHLTLIGPRTGPAVMFTGPFIYYLTALFTPFGKNPYLVVMTSITCAFVTGLALIYLGRRYLLDDRKIALTLIFWAVSPFIVYLDRMPWNPNLSLLSASLVFYPLIGLTRRRAEFTDYFLVGIGSWLGYQAHFSGFLLPVLAGVICLIFYRRQLTLFLASCLGLLISIIPTVLFDLRHSWLNLHGLMALANDSDTVSRFQFLIRLSHNVFILFENQGKLLVNRQSAVLVVGVGFFIILIYLIWLMGSRVRKRQAQLLIPLLWVSLVAFLYSYYRLPAPEYYYMIQFPAFLFILTELSLQLYLLHKPIGFLLLAIFLVNGLRLAYQTPNQIGKLSLGDQYAVSRYLHLQVAAQPIQDIQYRMPHAANLGLVYLLEDIPKHTGGASYTVIFPAQSYETYTRQFGLIGIRELR